LEAVEEVDLIQVIQMVVVQEMVVAVVVEAEVAMVVLVEQVHKEETEVGELAGQMVMDLVVVEEHIKQEVMEVAEIVEAVEVLEIILLG
jgi:hypothetical protein